MDQLLLSPLQCYESTTVQVQGGANLTSLQLGDTSANPTVSVDFPLRPDMAVTDQMQ